MAVPKKRKSKTKTRQTKAVWKNKAVKVAEKSLSLAKSVLTGNSKFFYTASNSKASDSENT